MDDSIIGLLATPTCSFRRFQCAQSTPWYCTFVAAPKIEYHWDLIHRYSSLKRLLRVTALCFKIVRRLRKHSFTAHPTNISTEEMEAAKIFWIKATQAAFFSHEINTLKSNSILSTPHAFTRLTAFLDHKVVI
ncbi:hypothetical protein M0804_013766 [Polistes exclamans]|nr:hypothetical protein M0804_013766 [Polistes exclamans]